jgi:hypothetical protein
MAIVSNMPVAGKGPEKPPLAVVFASEKAFGEVRLLYATLVDFCVDYSTIM